MNHLLHAAFLRPALPTIGVALIATATLIPLQASAEEAGKTSEAKAPFDPSKAVDMGVGMPTPYDKFLALSQIIGRESIDWLAIFNSNATDIDPDDFSDTKVGIPLALGVRVADGVMAIQARDAEVLGQCASDIEKLAKKLDVPDSDLTRARRIRTLANENRWLEVFLELGILQQDIMQELEKDDTDPRGKLLVISGWVQGARYSTTIVSQHYSAETSNFLREPLLAKALRADIDKLAADVKSQANVVKLAAVLDAVTPIVDIPLDGSISKEDVEKIHTECTSYVTGLLDQ